MSGAAAVRLVLAASGLTLLGHGLWLPLKAEVAQVLLERAWRMTLQRGGEERPWPWADTWPVAKLRIGIANLESDQRENQLRTVDRIVLAGVDGASLAFGPGLDPRSARPGSGGHTVLAGHRDTHFRFVRRLAVGDEIEMQAADGNWTRYRVVGTQVVDQESLGVLAPTSQPVLTLVTCYPFDAVTAGGNQRYVVRASAVESTL